MGSEPVGLMGGRAHARHAGLGRTEDVRDAESGLLQASERMFFDGGRGTHREDVLARRYVPCFK